MKGKILLQIIIVLTVILTCQDTWTAEQTTPQTVVACEEFSCRELKPANPPMTGKDATELQEVLLRDLSIDPGPINGIYGTKTVQAVATFQRLTGLKQTGIVNLDTWNQLGRAYETMLVAKKPDPKPPGKVSLEIDINKRQLTVLADGKVVKKYPVAIGKSKTPSPIGEWKVVHKDYNWGTGFGTRWMGLNVPWGIYGIHGTNKPWSIGRAESHGCFRMFNKDVEELFEWVPVGTPVKIIGPDRPIAKRVLKKGMTGQDVVMVQLRLKEKSLFFGPADGRFGSWSEFSVKYLQHHHSLKPTGIVDRETYRLLGF